VGIQELGPRFTLKLRSLQKGTFDSKFGEYEWVHKVSSKTNISFMKNVVKTWFNLSIICVCHAVLTLSYYVSAPWNGLLQKKIPSLRDRRETQDNRI